MGWKWLDDFKANAAKKIAQFKNSDFRDASMATCALIAAADGSIDPSEKSKVAALIGKSELLACFDASELKVRFEEYCDKTDEFGRIDLLRKVGKLKGNLDQSDACVKVALVIANADGDFADSEKKVVAELCKTLGLPSGDYLA